MKNLRESKIAIIGLGYVGLPLAVAFAKQHQVIGFDIDRERITALKNNTDRTGEVSPETLKQASSIRYTCNEDDLADADIYIITVPTPIDNYKKPDLQPLKKASQLVGKYLIPGNIVIYESTVYPGCTEEICVPELTKASGLVFNKDFYCGYSPERINPGDKAHSVHNVVKVTSGSTPQTADIVDQLYQRIVKAGTHKVSSIKVAEASKIIENTQRDINISFVNELALIFDRMDIDTTEVLEAAGTKWNFLPFRPGLVGGHCIGVDPYYLMHKAESLGYYPQVILSGRRINDNMGKHVANKVLKLMVKYNHDIKKSKILVLGITYKDNCPDIRNSKVIDLINELKSFGASVDVYDPVADKETVSNEHNINLLEKADGKYDAVILAVSHKEFRPLNLDALKKSNNTVIYDVKSFFPKAAVTARL